MSDKKTNLTQRDLEITAIAFKCFKNDPQVDYAKLADLAKFKNPASASAVWGPIKKKLLSYAPDTGDTPNSASNSGSTNGTTPVSTSKKRRTKAAADGDAAEGTPKKKQRGRAAQQKATKQVESEVENDEEGEEAGVSVKEEGDGADAADQVLDGMDEYLKAEEVDL